MSIFPDAMPEAARVDAAIPTDSAGFRIWVSPHLRALAAVASREVESALVEDVVQEALLRAWRRRRTFDTKRGSARPWLMAILLDQCRRHRTRSRPLVLSTDGVPQHAGPENPEERLDLEALVCSLPRRQRQVITLHYLADLAVDDVAAALGIRPGTVKSTLADARKQLRILLESES